MRRRLPLRTLLVGALPLLLLCGCQRARQVKDTEESPPFVFRSLDLRQQDPQGHPAWQLTSPEARYDLGRSIARADRPRGVIYSGGQPLYHLQAESGTVISDGEAILLEGKLRMERLREPKVLIEAPRARWLPRQKLLLVDHSPQAYDRQGRLNADRARFRFDSDTLELTGSPRMERWAQPFNPLGERPKGPPQTSVQVHQISWVPSTGQLDAMGPVMAEQRPTNAAPDHPPQRLSAERLQGNTQTQAYTLLGAVRFEDGGPSQRFEGRDVHLDLKGQSGTTALPFTFTRGALQGSGSGLRVLLKQGLAQIENQCRVSQPGETLEAQRCQWNWLTGAVEAHGSVVLRRQANQQESRADELVGSLAQGGSVTIISPGGKVTSRFQIPRQRR